MKVKECWLVFRASDQSFRVKHIGRSLSLQWDEVAWKIRVRVPDPWGGTLGVVEVTVPEMPPAGVTVTALAEPAP